VPRNLVDHTVYDHSSLLATVERLFGLPPLTDRDAQAGDVTHLLSASEPREAPWTLPDPADSGITCADRAPRAEPDHGPVPAALRAFVELAAIQDGRLRPDRARAAVDRARAATTVEAARAYLAEVAERLRAAGLGGGSVRHRR